MSTFIIKLNRVDLITLTSVITSALSVKLSLDGKFFLAMSVLYIAMLADALDGLLARKYGLERDFGRYLDSFMDVLIYLVSPAMLAYCAGYNGYYPVLLLLMIGFGCVRLAVFNQIGNIQESNGLSYLGMPVFWSIFIVSGYLLLSLINASFASIALSVALISFCLAMITHKPFYKFKSLTQILLITVGGALLFLAIHCFIG
ncbi:MAG: CDP-diacylglycerol--serine O-phosphatidyltransferase [Gammaproteobacteria bacterium]|nr:MAG: CDP-diacylglycerol--serine O-phosphatidyltransferase [Gammaproteobacteria bacterium]